MVHDGALVVAVILTAFSVMALETLMTLGIGRALLLTVLDVSTQQWWTCVGAICFLQLLSYVVSPQVCYLKGKAVRNSFETAESQWKKAQPVRDCGVGLYRAGPVLWWGVPGMLCFAPAVWKMDWAGKTVQPAQQVPSVVIHRLM